VHAWDTLPQRLPVAGTLIVWLLLDRFKPPRWVWYAAAGIMALVWLFNLFLWSVQVPVNLFKKTIDGKYIPDLKAEIAAGKSAGV
jgi:hypothetical protein